MREQLESLVLGMQQPALLADAELNLLCANGPLRAIFPGCAGGDSLRLLLPGCSLEQCSGQLQRGTQLSLADPLLEQAGLRLELTPFGTGAAALVLGRLCGGEPAVPAGLSGTVAVFSHMYRQPLSEIFGLMSVIQNRLHARSDDSCDPYLDSITQNCYQMLRSFSNLTELYKLYSGTAAPEGARPVDLWELTRSLCESAGVLTKASGIPLTADLPQAPACVLCDPDRLSMAVVNLLSNACQFTREGNRITVTGRVSGPNAVLTVADRGLGIPQELQGRVFEPFFSWDPNDMPFAGAGLGLTLVHYVAASLGGSVALQSRELEGTTVALSVPLYRGSQPPNACFDASSLLSDRFSPVYVGLSNVCRCPQ